MKPFYFKDHTADIAMVVTGATREELFAHAAEGLAMQAFCAPEKLSGYRIIQREIKLNAPAGEDLFVDWLNELIYLFFTDGFLYRTAHFSTLQETGLSGSVEGYTIPQQDMVYAKEIKAATYHGLAIAKKDTGYEAEVILDI